MIHTSEFPLFLNILFYLLLLFFKTEMRSYHFAQAAVELLGLGNNPFISAPPSIATFKNSEVEMSLVWFTEKADF